MTEVQLPATPGILRVAELLDQTIEMFLRDSLPSIPRVEEYYEADLESLHLMCLIIRHVESIICLAREDLVFLPSAYVLARTAFEASIRLLWLLDPLDPFEREVRWLAYQRSEEEFWSALLSDVQRMDLESGHILKMRDSIRDFRESVENRLPRGYEPMSAMPSFRSMLESLRRPEKYTYYRILCQFVHASPEALKVYRRGYGTSKEFGELVKPTDWHLPLVICWDCLHSSGHRILQRLSGDQSKYVSEALFEAVQAALAEIR